MDIFVSKNSSCQFKQVLNLLIKQSLILFPPNDPNLLLILIFLNIANRWQHYI